MYRTLLSQLRTPPLTGAKLVYVMTTARFELPCMRPTRGHHPPSLVAARCAISALPEPRRHRGFVSQVASFRRRGLYFLKKPFDFGQGLRASEKDSDRMRYDRNIVRDERSALVHQKKICDDIRGVNHSQLTQPFKTCISTKPTSQGVEWSNFRNRDSLQARCVSNSNINVHLAVERIP